MKRALTILFFLMSAGLGAMFYLSEKETDRTAPVITFPGDPVLYEEGQERSVLLEGVRARDDRDGDVTNTLIIENVIPMKDGVSATVLYYAKDHSGNVAKVNRIVDYQPQGGFAWQKVEQTEAPEPEAETEIETETEDYPEDGCPRIYLTTDHVTVRKGESYDLLSYVKKIVDDKDDKFWLYRQVHIEGMYDINGPGVYELYYSVVDRQWNQSNKAKLTLTIE